MEYVWILTDTTGDTHNYESSANI